MSLLIASTVVVVFLFAGCAQSQQQRADEPVSVRAAIATDCIVHYYKTNASSYITRQRHGYNPSAGFFQAISTEPVGVVQCSLLKDDYDSSEPKQQSLSDLPDTFWSKNLAASVFYGFCAAGGLLETESMLSAENIKIEGRWYKPLKPRWPSGVELTLLQSLETKRVESVLLEDPKEGLAWLMKVYNIRYNKELSRYFPRTIDVFDIRNGVGSKELMIRFDYKDIQKVHTQGNLKLVII
ncbi:MAG: hypothetical protein B6I25_00060 [Planctomycetales bacterium 4572_13]|nr:MAG: hypothetical protein B6I25_00060 [Planctomycetales bacterium 4572_13]